MCKVTIKLLPCWCLLLITYANSLDPDQAQTAGHAEGIPGVTFGKHNFFFKSADDKKN